MSYYRNDKGYLSKSHVGKVVELCSQVTS